MVVVLVGSEDSEDEPLLISLTPTNVLQLLSPEHNQWCHVLNTNSMFEVMTLVRMEGSGKWYVSVG
jgi:phosphoribosylanthranilate isomerase